MKGRRYRGKYSGVFGRYSEYFKVAIHSHFTARVLAVWRLGWACFPAYRQLRRCRTTSFSSVISSTA
jgi:hypothetical protein